MPIFNEEANLATLLQRLACEEIVSRIIAIDDCSTDRSLEILRDFEMRDGRVCVIQQRERSGQLAGWLRIAAESEDELLIFVDADAAPEPGAIARLASRFEDGVALVSGRVVPVNASSAFPAARFRGNVLHRVRSLGYPKEAIIGRFFAVRRDWFIANVASPDIIANDAYLACTAAAQGLSVVYEPQAVCRYTEATVTFDFAAQRQRADSGYAQLRERGIMRAPHEPPAWSYIKAIVVEALHDPRGASSWAYQQALSRTMKAYAPKGRDVGGWETQPTTKRRIE